MRRWVIVAALVANALMSALVLLLVLNGGGWGEATQLSTSEAELLVIVALTALVLDLVLIPVLGLSFWARDRGFRKQAAELQTLRQQPPGGGTPPGEGPPDRGSPRSE